MFVYISIVSVLFKIKDRQVWIQYCEEVLLELFCLFGHSCEHVFLIQSGKLWLEELFEFFSDLLSQEPLSYLMDNVDLVGLALSWDSEDTVLVIDLLECLFFLCCILFDFGFFLWSCFCCSSSLAFSTFTLCLFWSLKWNYYSDNSFDRKSSSCSGWFGSILLSALSFLRRSIGWHFEHYTVNPTF